MQLLIAYAADLSRLHNMQEFDDVMEIACAGSSELAARHRSMLWEVLTCHFTDDLVRLDPRAPTKIVQAALFLECCSESSTLCIELQSCIKQRCSKDSSPLSCEERRAECLSIVRARMRMYS
jgi:hypothetical protein